ncbi:tetratricopeptide repeat protein [Fulvimonas sp. R45]|nr:tetratricopeptide repeat protein [Fulvimonas sp. R45]
MLTGAALALALASTPAMARSHQDKEKAASQYPNATRAEPKLDLTSEKESKALNEGLAAANSGDKAKATQLLQPIIDGSKSKYAKALALQGMASLAYNQGDLKGAINLLQQALADGVLPNDTYFQLEYELAQFYLADQQYQQSIDTVEKWRAEGKRETADSYALEGNAYYRLQKYPEAIAAIKKAEAVPGAQPKPSWNQILMAAYAESGQSDQASQLAQQQLSSNPNDPDALNNAVAVLMQAQKYPEAIKVMEDARAKGNLKTEKEYVNLAKLYLITGQNSSSDPKSYADKAIAVLDDGMGKGVVTSSYDNYKLLGDAAYIGGENAKAIDAYKKAIPMAKDGEAAVRAGQLLLSENKYSEAKGLIQQGIDKGVQHTGTAYMLLAEAKRGLKDKAGAIAAMHKAEQDPSTASKAKAWLQKAGAE